ASEAPVSYVCDAISHRIHVIDGRGRWVESFGERGRRPGQFDHPSDATLVMPMFEGEDPAESAYTALVAVADRMNHRVQIFEPAGQFVTALGGSTHTDAARDMSTTDEPAERDGWPFFRVTPDPAFNEPVRLRWRAPWLEVTEAGGAVHRID